MTTAPLKIVLVDDHSLCRSGLTDLLQQRGQMQVAAATGDPAQVAELLRLHAPDLVVLDLTMPRLSGHDTFRQLHHIDPDVAVLFASGYSAEHLAESDKDGVLGFINFAHGEVFMVGAMTGMITSNAYAQDGRIAGTVDDGSLRSAEN